MSQEIKYENETHRLLATHIGEKILWGDRNAVLIGGNIRAEFLIVDYGDDPPLTVPARYYHILTFFK